MLFPELVSPGKYKQVKIGREEIKNIGKNGSILLQLRRTRESTSPVVSTRNPKQNFLSSSNLFSKKTIPLAVHNYIAFTQIAARGWPYYVPRSKDSLPLKEPSINSFSWSGPADSHFVHSFFHKCVVLNYQPGWPSSAATWFEWGGPVY